MRIPVITGGVALCAGIMLGTQILSAPNSASAQSEVVTILKSKQSDESSSRGVEKKNTEESQDVVAVAVESILSSVDKDQSEENPKPEEVKHVVESGQSLEEIAKLYEIADWKRIFYKNTDIEDPNILEVDQEIFIPADDEELEERDIPVFVAPVAEEPAMQGSSTTSTSAAPAAAPKQVRGATSGNGYSYGYCTWYVKNQRPDLPNNLGSANTWYSRAAAQGYSVGYSPRVGAAAEALTGYMHVAYVTAVHGDGTITVSEMNFNGWNVVSSRRVSASAFRYIY